MNQPNSDIARVKECIDGANRVFVLTGAGVSAESGVPTFRDAGGHWKKIDPYQVATPEAFERDPAFVWKWYDKRRVQLNTVDPNPAHYALAQLEKEKEDFFLLTQNVDDLHERAGSVKLAHIHGKIWEVRCMREGTAWEDRRAPFPEIPPRCERCGALVRPNVVWFGESIDTDAIESTERYLSKGAVDVALIIGTEASFGYITHWATRSIGPSGLLVEINPGVTDLSSSADICLRGPAGEILPLIIPT